MCSRILNFLSWYELVVFSSLCFYHFVSDNFYQDNWNATYTFWGSIENDV